MEKTLKVLAIKNGTVIDHLTAGTAVRIVKILKLENHENTITIGINLPGKKGITKDLIKIEKMELTSDQVNEIALLSPSATINIIKNYQVVKKFNVKIPDELTDIITCPNPKCVTNHEQVSTKFLILFNNKKFKLKCHFCERVFNQEEIYDYMA